MTGRSKGDLPVVYYLSGYHPVNESFIRSPPNNVVLRSRVPLDTFSSTPKTEHSSRSWVRQKSLVDRAFAFFDMPRLVPVVKRCDLIHTNGSIIPMTTKPWIASIENPSAFYGFREEWHENIRTKKRLAGFLLSKRCRAILPYSEASRTYIRLSLAEWIGEIEKKMQILHPSVDEYLVTADDRIIAGKETSGNPVRFLFVGNHFFDKGGREVLRAFRSVRSAEKCLLTIVSSAPAHQEKEFKEWLPRLQSEPGVEFHRTGMPRDALIQLYKDADVFVFPSYMDQVPFVLLEAMAAGLPIIGSNSYAIPEMVKEGENGFNIESPVIAFPRDHVRSDEHLAKYRREVMDEHNFDGVVEHLTKLMALLAGRRNLVAALGRRSLELVKGGDFSVTERNRRLGAVYDQSLRDS